jgi:hypothetical protein
MSHLIVVVFILIFAKTEKTQWERMKEGFSHNHRVQTDPVAYSDS